MKFWHLILESRRRRVFRGVGLYVVGSWILLQIGDVVVEPLGLPEWSMTALLYMIFLCFPIAIFLDWRYDITDKGIVRTKRLEGNIEEIDFSLKAKDYIIFSAVIGIILIGAYGIFSSDQNLIVSKSIEQQDPSKIESTPKAVLPNSVAVLPFTDMSASQDQQYFGNGLADTVLHLLAGISELNVAARTSSFSFIGQNKNIIEIAHELGVENVLEGSVQRAGSRIRVIAQLIEAKNGTHLWSGIFDEDINNVFEIQDQIAREVVSAMHVALADSESTRLSQRYKPNIQSYDSSVLGTYAFSKGSAGDLQEAERHFRRAIELDPNYPLPYIYLAETLGQLEVYTLGYQDTFSGLPTIYTRKLQEPLITKAIELDANLGEAYAAHAAITVDEAKAEELFNKALRLNPSYANAYLWYGRYLSIRKGQYEQALEQINKALELDPLSDPVLFERAKMVWASGQAEKAMALMLENVKRSPNFPPAYKRMVRWYSQRGDFAKAGQWVLALRKLDPDSPSHWGEWGGECWVYERLNATQEGKKCTTEFIAAHPDSVRARMTIAELSDAKNGMFLGPASLALLEQLVMDEPGNDYRANQYASALEQTQQYQKALDVLQIAHPQLFIEQPIVNGETTWAATVAINSLQKLDRHEQANRLLDAYESGISSIRLIEGPGFTNGIEDVEAAALRGDKEKALDILESKVKRGWRFIWNFLPYYQSLESISSDPRFKKIYAELEADIEQQYQRFLLIKDQPLY